MLSTEDTASERSSSPLQAAQLRDEQSEGNKELESSADELIEDLSDDRESKSFFDTSPEPGPCPPASELDRHREHLPVAEAPSASVKKSPSLRSNKHPGSSATWRDRTASERQTATSLDQLRARHLTAHLYNFYILKRRLNDTGKEQGKEHQYDAYITGSGRTWVSSKTWTAWPMLPEVVPRESDAIPWEAIADRESTMKGATMSSHEALQELLAARACKNAKEKFHERGWEHPSVGSPASPNDPWLTKEAQILEMVDGPGRAEEDEPLVMADDERAKSVLRPSLNHVLRQLDALLMGLHHARSSYATHSRSSTNPQATTDSESSTDNQRKRKASCGAPSRQRNRRRKVSLDVAETSSSVEPQFDAPHGQRFGSKCDSTKASRSRSLVERIGLRDWSDVLGVASMCRWDPGVVGRAAVRCSDLFGERLVFRTLHEGQDGYHDTNYLPRILATERLHESAPVDRDIHPQATKTAKGTPRPEPGHQSALQSPVPVKQGQDDKVGGVHVDGFLQPIPKHRSWTRERKGGRKK